MKDGLGGLIEVVEFAKARGVYGVNFPPIMPPTILPVFNKDGQAKKSSEGIPYCDLLQSKRML